MKVYILLAFGRLLDLPASTMLHVAAQAFTTPEQAAAHIPEFKKKITTRKDKFDLKCLDPDLEIKVRVEELELVR